MAKDCVGVQEALVCTEITAVIIWGKNVKCLVLYDNDDGEEENINKY